MGLLMRVIGVVSAVTGLAVTVALIPLLTLLGKKLASIRKESMTLTDARVKLCTEVLTGGWGTLAGLFDNAVWAASQARLHPVWSVLWVEFCLVADGPSPIQASRPSSCTPGRSHTVCSSPTYGSR